MVLVGIVTGAYKSLSGRLDNHDLALQSEREADLRMEQRMALLEQRGEDQHNQILGALARMTNEVSDYRGDIRAWREDSLLWREKMGEQLAAINKRP